MKELLKKKLKTYSVPVRSHSEANYIIRATSKEEANLLVADKMKRSMERMLKNTPKDPQIQDLTGWTETIKTMIQIVNSCLKCGCTEDQACRGGCYWVTKNGSRVNLCSKCAV